MNNSSFVDNSLYVKKIVLCKIGYRSLILKSYLKAEDTSFKNIFKTYFLNEELQRGSTSRYYYAITGSLIS